MVGLVEVLGPAAVVFVAVGSAASVVGLGLAVVGVPLAPGIKMAGHQVTPYELK